MDRIGLRPDPARDFDHPRVDAATHPELVAHRFYALTVEQWRAAK